jgi:hypothetical protein
MPSDDVRDPASAMDNEKDFGIEGVLQVARQFIKMPWTKLAHGIIPILQTMWSYLV